MRSQQAPAPVYDTCYLTNEALWDGYFFSGAAPWLGVDPIVTSAQIVLGLQTIVSRTLDLNREPAVVTIGAIKGGVRENIIPDSVEMRGTIRSFDEEMRDAIHERITTLAEGIAAGYGAHDNILKGVGIEIEAGEIVAVLGPNGAGKSTLLKTIAGLVAPRSGAIELAGVSIAGLPPSPSSIVASAALRATVSGAASKMTPPAAAKRRRLRSRSRRWLRRRARAANSSTLPQPCSAAGMAST